MIMSVPFLPPYAPWGRGVSRDAALPSDRGAAPREPRPERCEDEELATLQTALRQRLVQRDRDRRRSGVAVLLNVRVHLIVAQADRLLHHLEDAQVGLVWHEQPDVGWGEPVGL